MLLLLALRWVDTPTYTCKNLLNCVNCSRNYGEMELSHIIYIILIAHCSYNIMIADA